MRVRWLSLVAASALAIATAAALAPAAGASGAVRSVHVGRAAHASSSIPTLSVLYNQNNNDSGVGIVSQDFTDAGGSFDIYDSQGADDFVVNGTIGWLVQGVAVTGVYFGGTGPADSENVTFYKDAGGLPGAVAAAATGLHGTDTAGSFRIPLGANSPKLRNGTYWVSVQIAMPFSTGQGEWGWETTSVQHGAASVWQNPGNGFGTGCTTYANMNTCIGALGEGPDFMFTIAGVAH